MDKTYEISKLDFEIIDHALSAFIRSPAGKSAMLLGHAEDLREIFRTAEWGTLDWWEP